MERDNLRLEALKMAEGILNNNYQNSVNKWGIWRSGVYPTQPTNDDIINLAQKLIDFIVK